MEMTYRERALATLKPLKTALIYFLILFTSQNSYSSNIEYLYVTDWLQDKVLHYKGNTKEFKGVFVKPGGGYLHQPADIAVAADGTLFVSGWGSDDIRRYSSTGNLLSVFVDSGSGTLSQPLGLAIGPGGNLYVIKSYSAVMRFNGTNGNPMGIAGDPDDATFIEGPNISTAYDIAFGPDNNIYISTWDGRVVSYDLNGNFLSEFVPRSNNAGLQTATSLAFHPTTGNLYVSSWFTHEIKAYSGPNSATPGQPLLGGTFIAASTGGLTLPEGIAFRSDGSLLVSSSYTNQIKLFDSNGNFLANLNNSAGDVALTKPKGLALATNGNIYVANRDSNEIVRYTSTTANPARFTTSESRQGGLDSAGDLVFGPGGNLYVTNYGSGDVKTYNGNTGRYIRTFVPAGSGGLQAPLGLRFGANGDLYVADYQAYDVKVYDGNSGAHKRTINSGSQCSIPAYIEFVPKFLETDDPNGFFLVSCGHNKVVKINGSTHAVTNFINYTGDASIGGIPCKLSYPQGLKWNQFYASGYGALKNVQVVDYNNNALKYFWTSNMNCESEEPFHPGVSADLVTPGYPRTQYRPIDIQETQAGPTENWQNRYYVSVPEAGQIKEYNTSGATLEPIQVGAEGLSMPYGLTAGPKPSTTLSRFTSIRDFYNIHLLPRQARQKFNSILSEKTEKDTGGRIVYLNKFKQKASNSVLDKTIMGIIQTMPEEQFELYAKKMRLLSELSPIIVAEGAGTTIKGENAVDADKFSTIYLFIFIAFIGSILVSVMILKKRK